jgi:hypothetical protein
MRFKKKDMFAATVLTLLAAASYAFGFFFILDHKNKPIVARIHLTMMIYGAIQLFIGFVTGYWLGRCWLDDDENRLYFHVEQQEVA